MSIEPGVRPWFTTGSPYEELALAYDPTAALRRLRARRRRFVSRIISLLITLGIMIAIYVWRPEQFVGASLWVVYGIVLAISLGFAVFSLIGWLQARKVFAGIGQGIALRLGRPGVEIGGTYVPWTSVGSLAVRKGKLGHGPQFTVTRGDGQRLAVPLDQLAVFPATLDSTARAYSGGRLGVDLTALGN